MKIVKPYQLIKQMAGLFLVTAVLFLFQNCAPLESINSVLSGASDLSSGGGSEGYTKYASGTIDDLKNTCAKQGEGADVTPIRRLTKEEYQNTLPTVTTAWWYIGTNFASWTGRLFQLMPEDTFTDSISTFNRFTATTLTMTYENVASYHDIANEVGTRIKFAISENNDNIVRSVFDNCYNRETTTAVCFDKMLNNFGLRAFRRPLTSDELADVKSISASGTMSQRLENAIYFFLMSPQFLFHLPINGTVDGHTLALDQYEIASKLSYAVTGSMPDSTLMNLARDGKLTTADEIKVAVDGILVTQKNNETQGGSNSVKTRFNNFVKEWLRPSQIIYRGDKLSVATAAGFLIEDGNQQRIARENVLKEFDDQFNYFVFDTNGSYHDLLTHQKSFARDAYLAGLYNTSIWDGASVPPNYPAGERKGFLTSAALLSYGGSISNPFMRGGEIHKHILCRDFGGLPQPNVFPIPEATGELITTRKRYESLVPRGSACMGCHVAIESMGMPFETYDAFGRYRGGIEKVYDSTGTKVGELAINTFTQPKINDSLVSVLNAPELIGQIADGSTEAYACFAKQYFRYTNSRYDQPRDACMNARFAERLKNGGVREALKEYWAEEWFRKKSLK